MVFKLASSAIHRKLLVTLRKSPILETRRCYSAMRSKEENKKLAYYATAFVVFVFGVSYGSVPLYKVFCQVTGFGGTTQRTDVKVATVKPVDGRVIKIEFTSSVHAAMPWKFRPTQASIKVVPGETALAFYTVKNPTDKAITGVATYNVHPPKAGLYFNKIQCFCFEEQRLGPHEEIDMPVFFFIDPEFAKDPAMDGVSSIVLSYTFFKTDEEDIAVPAVDGSAVRSTNVPTKEIISNNS